MRLGWGWDSDVPEVGSSALGTCEEGRGRLRGTEKLTRRISKDSTALEPDERRHTKESVRERGILQEVHSNRETFVREKQFTCDVVSATDGKSRTIWESVRDLG